MRIHKYIKYIKEEVCSAKHYACKYLEYKTEKPGWAKMYYEMAEEELKHAEYLHEIADEYASGLSWMPEEDKIEWGNCTNMLHEKTAWVKMMLSM